ncbi:unnamed protein product [Rotaria sp. Silwood2]|nr:unnamed protein product [Rotaria sp. Silwood2]CAF3227381.1 unnamed protein product [Rotaria sp. Silwood2]CAF4089305.1 unnamed protein product [Rotaria sp. Silwood2]CAF4102068.1 unnamed protein product [Rotaria sp. Silwood2]
MSNKPIRSVEYGNDDSDPSDQDHIQYAYPIGTDKYFNYGFYSSLCRVLGSSHLSDANSGVGMNQYNQSGEHDNIRNDLLNPYHVYRATTEAAGFQPRWASLVPIGGNAKMHGCKRFQTEQAVNNKKKQKNAKICDNSTDLIHIHHGNSSDICAASSFYGEVPKNQLASGDEHDTPSVHSSNPSHLQYLHVNSSSKDCFCN